MSLEAIIENTIFCLERKKRQIKIENHAALSLCNLDRNLKKNIMAVMCRDLDRIDQIIECLKRLTD